MLILWFCIFLSVHIHQIDSQSGPDPWHYNDKPSDLWDESNLPPDIRMPLKKKTQAENKPGLGEWLFRRMLTIVLKGGQTQQNEDGSMDISLQMKFEPTQWKTLEECLESDTPLTEDMLRRSIGYVQESIYTPSIVEKIVMAWSDYVTDYLTYYKTHITWTLGFLASAGGLFWLWSHSSHKHTIIILLLFFYAYEVIISFKEAEQKEMEKFLSAVDRCNWFFWKSTCDVPPPDPLVFLKHMNPLKIAMRMFTTALAEPIIAISGTVEVMLHGITDDLWYPFNKIAYAILTLVINIFLIYFLIMIIFNWLLNIPFHLGFGLFGISIRQRERTLFTNETTQRNTVQESNRVSQATIDKILDVCTLALSNSAQNSKNTTESIPSRSNSNLPKMRRSASTGRLPNLSSYESTLAIDNRIRRRHDGSGDT